MDESSNPSIDSSHEGLQITTKNTNLGQYQYANLLHPPSNLSPALLPPFLMQSHHHHQRHKIIRSQEDPETLKRRMKASVALLIRGRRITRYACGRTELDPAHPDPQLRPVSTAAPEAWKVVQNKSRHSAAAPSSSFGSWERHDSRRADRAGGRKAENGYETESNRVE